MLLQTLKMLEYCAKLRAEAWVEGRRLVKGVKRSVVIDFEVIRSVFMTRYNESEIIFNNIKRSRVKT